jgi:acetyltransferase-like isoleucine patch superfamily enzyme
MTIWNKRIAARSRHWLRTCAQVGADPHLIGEPSIYADGRLQIGDRFHLSSRPVPSHLVAGPNGVLQIGDDVVVGCGAAISAFQHIIIGDGTQIAPYVIIMDTNFHGSPGDQSVLHDTRPVTIGKGCRIGSRVTITRGASIGDGAEILAGSVVSSDIPAGVCAAGARARIIGRAGDINSRWDSAAALLPDILVTSLGLSSAPNIDGSPIPAGLWSDARAQHLLNAIKDGFGVALDHSTASTLETYADVAAAVQRLLPQRA